MWEFLIGSSANISTWKTSKDDSIFQSVCLSLSSIVFVCLPFGLFVSLSSIVQVSLSLFIVSVFLSIFYLVCLSIFQFVFLFIFFFVRLSIFQSVCLSIFHLVCLSFVLFASLSFIWFVCLSFGLFLCLSICYISIFCSVCHAMSHIFIKSICHSIFPNVYLSFFPENSSFYTFNQFICLSLCLFNLSFHVLFFFIFLVNIFTF